MNDKKQNRIQKSIHLKTILYKGINKEMKKKDIIQSSILQQNIFFQNLPEDDITQYKLKKPSQRRSLASGRNDDKKLRGNRQSAKIEQFMNKVKTQSVRVKLQLQNGNIQESSNMQRLDDNLYQDLSIKEIEKCINQQQNKQETTIVMDITDIDDQISSRRKDLKQQLVQNENQQKINQQNQQQELGIIAKQIDPSKDKLVQNEWRQNRKSINFCLSLDDDSDDSSNEQENKKNKSQVKTIEKPQQKNKFKKINYINRKSNNQSLLNKIALPSIINHEQQNDHKQQLPKIEYQKTKQLQQEQTKYQSKEVKRQKNDSLTQVDKKPVLLMKFDDSGSQESSQSSLSDDERQTMMQIQPNSIKQEDSQKPQKPSNPHILASKQKQNIFINNFEESSSSSSQSLPHPNHLLLKPSSIDSSHSISSNDKQIKLIRPLDIIQFSRMTLTETYIYEPIPQNCIFQSVVKRYQQPNQNNLVYEMFDHATYKSILKVRQVSEGFQFFSTKEALTICWNGNSKNLPKSNQETSCALLCSNFFGTQFNCFKFNRNNQKPDISKHNRLITIDYQTNIFGLNGPRRMQVYVPLTNYLIRGQKNLRQAYDSQKQLNQKEPTKIQNFVNRKPRWSSEISSFVLNFSGRASVSSVKNFIITRRTGEGKRERQHHENLVLFGKMQKNVFNLDIKYPFNLVQGLALALSSFDKKIACQ